MLALPLLNLHYLFIIDDTDIQETVWLLNNCSKHVIERCGMKAVNNTTGCLISNDDDKYQLQMSAKNYPARVFYKNVKSPAKFKVSERVYLNGTQRS